MKISEIVDKVENEKQTPGRFPSRVIFIRNWADYITLVNDLRNVCDITLNLADADFTKDDIVPKFDTLKQKLIKYNNKTILLLSFGEYLRLCAKREANKEQAEFKSIWEPDPVLPEHETTKYIIPIFGGRELFDNAVSYVDKRLEMFLWELTESSYDSDYKVTVYSPEFTDAIEVDADSFSDWLSKWDTLFADKTRKNFSLRTKLFRYADKMYGNVKIEVVNDPFTYVISLVTDGNMLKKEYGDDLFWNNVAKNVRTGKPFSSTIDYVLNVGHSFDSLSILARFEQLSNTERSLLWLRYKIYSSNDYESYAIGKTNNPDEIPSVLRDAIFTLAKPSDNQLEERLKTISLLNLHYDNSYFAKLDKIMPIESRLSYLSYKTAEERVYAVKTVSELLRKGGDMSALAALLKQGYPEFAEYLSPTTNTRSDVTKYFDWYRKNKLINRVPEDIPYGINFESIDSRNKIIQNSENGYPFWIDGLGVEWLPLLVNELKKLSIESKIDPQIACSILPTVTEYNHQWKHEDEKWDRLDKLSHNGTSDDKNYFSCIAMQIEHVCAIARRVDELLTEHNCVIVTGDHGSSRIAALMFHADDNFAIEPQKNVKVREFGRFCELSDGNDIPITESMEIVTSYNYTEKKDLKCVVIRTYEHFKQSGNVAGGNTDDNAVAGEVHGGATPEEYLVPVIVVKRKTLLAIDSSETVKKRQAVTQNAMGI